MASAQQQKDVTVTATAKDFEYNAGMWEIPKTNDEPAKLTYGDKIEAIASLDTYDLSQKTAHIGFMVGKPKEGERCFGWENSHLTLTAVMGSKSATFDFGYMYQSMPRGKISTFGMDLDMSDNTDPVHKKLHFTLSDKDATPKAGLDFYWARIVQPSDT